MDCTTTKRPVPRHCKVSCLDKGLAKCEDHMSIAKSRLRGDSVGISSGMISEGEAEVKSTSDVQVMDVVESFCFTTLKVSWLESQPSP